MSTGYGRVHIYAKRILTADDFDSLLLGPYEAELRALFYRTFSDDAVFGAAIPVAATGNNKVNVGDGVTRYGATGGVGSSAIEVSSFLPETQNLVIPPDAGVIYTVGLEKVLLDAEPQSNPVDGKIQYRFQSEYIGRRLSPNAVTDNGNGTITFNVNSLFESGKDYSGTKVRVWLKRIEDGGAVGPKSTIGATAFETLTVAYSGGNNTITTVAAFGQSGISTTAGDYWVASLGPTVKRKALEDLRNTAGCIFLADVTSVAAANPITVIATTDQRVATRSLVDLTDLTKLAELAQVLRKDSHGFTKVRVLADASDAEEPQIEVFDAGSVSRFKVDEDGDVTAANLIAKATTLESLIAKATTLVDTPLVLAQDKDGRNRFLIEHCGLPGGQWSEFREDWTAQLSGGAALNNSTGYLPGNSKWQYDTNVTPGIALMQPPTGADAIFHRCELNSGAGGGERTLLFSALGYPLALADTVLVLSFSLCLPDAATSPGADFAFGLAKANTDMSADATDGYFLRKKNGQADWFAVVNSGGSNRAEVAGGVTLANNKSTRAKIEVHGANTAEGARVKFFVNGALVLNHTTNLVSGLTVYLYGMAKRVSANKTLGIGPVWMRWMHMLSPEAI